MVAVEPIVSLPSLSSRSQRKVGGMSHAGAHFHLTRDSISNTAQASVAHRWWHKIPERGVLWVILRNYWEVLPVRFAAVMWACALRQGKDG